MSEQSARFIDPQQLESLGNTTLRARAVVEGVMAGMHRNPNRGSSVEFAEYKEYAPGDEVRHIDWRAFARVDRYYVKQFEDETNVRAFSLLDVSGSMGFGWESAPTKFMYGATLVAAFSWLLLRQGDAPGLLLFRDEPGSFLPPSSRRSQLEDIGQILDQVVPGGATSGSRALSRIAEQVHRRSLIVVVSDFIDEHEELLTLCRILRKRGMEVVLFHLMDRAEWEFPWEEMTLFEGMEGEGQLLAEPDDLREAYRSTVRAHVASIEEDAVRGDLEYFRTFTDQPIEEVLLRFVNGRQRRQRR